LNALSRDLSGAAPFSELAAAHGVFFYYCGYFSQTIIAASADAIQQRMGVAGVEDRVRRRVLGAFVEMAQNIVHYSADRLTAADAVDDEIRFGTIVIARTEEGIVLSCSNPVDRETHRRLDPKLEAISRMNLDAIREAYRQALRAEDDAGSKGGGLGLLTLARGSTCPLRYTFEPSANSPELMVFELRITV
jgi:hypothetical protein